MNSTIWSWAILMPNHECMAKEEEIGTPRIDKNVICSPVLLFKCLASLSHNCFLSLLSNVIVKVHVMLYIFIRRDLATLTARGRIYSLSCYFCSLVLPRPFRIFVSHTLVIAKLLSELYTSVRHSCFTVPYTGHPTVKLDLSSTCKIPFNKE
jgi:hypothetical protein